MGRKIITIIVISSVIAATVAFVAIFSQDNPISRFLVEKGTESYLEKNYGDKNLKISDMEHGQEEKLYKVEVKSETSLDTWFVLGVNHFGKVAIDLYTTYVEEKATTYLRVNNEYSNIVQKGINAKDFPYEVSTISQGMLIAGKDDEQLVLDKTYDSRETGRKYGLIDLYLNSEVVSISAMKNIILNLKDYFDEKDIYFKKMDLSIEKKTDGKLEELAVLAFPYTEIYEDGLENRLSKAVADYKKQQEEQF